ncbi:MAG: hypothetical protein R8P61_30035 [Bacteroidia bacterium]|nr:hypothetical protein [Bacteroidia bacterium]
MERIQAIFNSLSRQELRYLKSFLNAFHGKGSNKALALLELLEKQPDLTQADASEKLYGNPKSKAFIMLKARLLEKMQETLILGVNLQNNNVLKEDPAAYEVVRIIKQISSALMLRKRGLEDIARELFEKCEHQAEEAGLPEFRLPPLIYLQNIAASRQKGTWEYSGEIAKTLEQYETDVLGIGIFDEFNLKTRNHSHFSEEVIEWLREKTKQLEKRLEVAYTLRTHYFYLNLLVSMYEGIQDYEQAKGALEELIDLVSSNKGLRSKNRLGTPYLKLAAVECLVYNFPAALEASLNARELYHPKKYNYFSASLYALFIQLYLGEWKAAEQMLLELQWFRNQKRRTQSIELTYYLEACLKHLQGDCKAAFQSLGLLQEILADKKGWNSSMRIYEIMLLLDMDMFDLAASRIESLRKHLAKYRGEDRHAKIFRYLYLLEKHAFDFQTRDDEMHELEQWMRLSDSWKAISHEVIRFDLWIQAKKENTGLAEAFTQSFFNPKTSLDFEAGEMSKIDVVD